MFLSDLHLPKSIPLNGVFDYIKDYSPDIIILGGDIIDADGLHGVDSMKAEAVDLAWYKRDCELIKGIMVKLAKAAPDATFIYLEGNHEERYARLARKYPKVFGDTFNFMRDAIPLPMLTQWIPYGNYDSFFEFGDTLFVHGTVWPDNHAKLYALRHVPYKVVYGHLHHFQAYTTHRANPRMNPRYAVTAGCLCELTPEWKKGEPHQWTNGFISFIYDGKTVIPTVHMIEKGVFNVGRKIYK